MEDLYSLLVSYAFLLIFVSQELVEPVAIPAIEGSGIAEMTFRANPSRRQISIFTHEAIHLLAQTTNNVIGLLVVRDKHEKFIKKH